MLDFRTLLCFKLVLVISVYRSPSDTRDPLLFRDLSYLFGFILIHHSKCFSVLSFHPPTFHHKDPFDVNGGGFTEEEGN